MQLKYRSVYGATNKIMVEEFAYVHIELTSE